MTITNQKNQNHEQRCKYDREQRKYLKEGRPEEHRHEHEVSSASRAIGPQTRNNLKVDK